MGDGYFEYSEGYCVECGNFIEDTRIMLTSDPPWYVYKCVECGAEHRLRRRPNIVPISQSG